MHVDHALDDDSARRARSARRLAAELGLAIEVRRVEVAALRRRRESPEAAARRLRYRELEAARSGLGATRILTAHHADDLVETVLLQISRGAPLEALGGIRAAFGAVRRPLLSLSRQALADRVAASGLRPTDDPSNADVAIPRNLVRHRLLPHLESQEPSLGARIAALAARSDRLSARLGGTFERWVTEDATQAGSAATDSSEGSSRLTAPDEWRPGIDRAATARLLGALPASLRMAALRWLLHERLGIERLPSRAALEAFCRALSDLRPALLHLRGEASDLRFDPKSGLSMPRRESRPPPFSYTFQIPGEVELPELGLRLRIRRSGIEAWMLQGDPRRVGFRAEPGEVTVRNRRPGDRIRPLGAPGERKLKELLIDRRIPAAERDRLPLLEIGGRIAWVPGVSLDEAHRLEAGTECWLAELQPLRAAATPKDGSGERIVD